MMNNRKKFIILAPGFPASEEDTTCLPMQQQFTRSLKNLYPHLDIVVLSFQYPYVKKTYRWFDMEVISFNGKNRGGVSRLLLRKKVNAVLQDLNKKNNIIGLLSFWYGECAVVGKLFARKHGLKHFCWISGQDARAQNHYLRRFPAQSSELVALSDSLQNEVEKNHGVKPFTVVAPGVDPGLFSKQGQIRDIDILAAGSLISLKQFPIFLSIVAKLKLKFPALKAVLIGDGPEKDGLQKIISSLGLEENVMLTGAMHYNEVIDLMQRAKVFLHPSSYEGFSGVCLEALNAGARVISFCRPMNEEIDNWHIVSTEEEMLQKTITILQDPGIVYQTKKVFPIEDTARKMMALFSDEPFIK
jgi:glycosyltransferase involved in cell wall biosynthesis